MKRPNITTLKNSRGKKGGRIAYGAVGVVAGAAVGVTAAVLLKDHKNREKVGEVFNELSHRAAQYIDRTVDRAEQPEKLKGVKNGTAKRTQKKAS